MQRTSGRCPSASHEGRIQGECAMESGPQLGQVSANQTFFPRFACGSRCPVDGIGEHGSKPTVVPRTTRQFYLFIGSHISSLSQHALVLTNWRVD